MTQTYTGTLARKRMENGMCPECGYAPEEHTDDYRFWIPRTCSLLPRGVIERIKAAREAEEEN